VARTAAHESINARRCGGERTTNVRPAAEGDAAPSAAAALHSAPAAPAALALALLHELGIDEIFLRDDLSDKEVELLLEGVRPPRFCPPPERAEAAAAAPPPPRAVASRVAAAAVAAAAEGGAVAANASQRGAAAEETAGLPPRQPPTVSARAEVSCDTPSISTNRRECCVCMVELGDQERPCCLAPCGHSQICKACADQCRTCPLCNSKITARVVIFF